MYSVNSNILDIQIQTKGSAVYTARHILASINPEDVFYFNPCEIPVSSNGARIANLDASNKRVQKQRKCYCYC
jgi:hypothetical protein